MKVEPIKFFKQYKLLICAISLSFVFLYLSGQLKQTSVNVIVTTLGFAITFSTFKRNNDLTLDKMMRDESTNLFQDKKAFELMYFLDIEKDTNKFSSDEKIKKYINAYFLKERDFDRFLLYMNRIAYLNEQEHGFNTAYFQFYFETLGVSDLIRWYLAYGTFINPKDESTETFGLLFENLKKHLSEKSQCAVKWDHESEKLITEPLYIKFSQYYHEIRK